MNDTITVYYSRRVEPAPGESRVLEATLTLSSVDEGVCGVSWIASLRL